MMKMSLTIVLLLALTPGSLIAGQIPQAQAEAAAKDFQVFWNEFRQAVKNNDKEKIASMTRFPFKTEDLGGHARNYTKESFLKIWGKLLQETGEYYAEGRPEEGTMRQCIERAVMITSREVGTESFVRVGDFEFEKAKGKWLFTRAFINDNTDFLRR